MITQETIADILYGDVEGFDAADRQAIKWQYGLHGDFFKSLFFTIQQADSDNQKRIAAGFPDEVEGFHRWTQGNLHQRMKIQEEKEKKQ